MYFLLRVVRSRPYSNYYTARFCCDYFRVGVYFGGVVGVLFSFWLVCLFYHPYFILGLAINLISRKKIERTPLFIIPKPQMKRSLIFEAQKPHTAEPEFNTDP